MQEPLTDSQSAPGSVSTLDNLLKILILQRRANQTGHVLKRGYLLHRYCSCKYNNKTAHLGHVALSTHLSFDGESGNKVAGCYVAP